MGPVLLLGLYRRGLADGRLDTALRRHQPNSLLEPESKDAWISRSVLGEQLWLEEGHGVFEANLPGVLNGLNAVAYCYGLFGAYKRNPQTTALGGGSRLRVNSYTSPFSCDTTMNTHRSRTETARALPGERFPIAPVRMRSLFSTHAEIYHRLSVSTEPILTIPFQQQSQ